MILKKALVVVGCSATLNNVKQVMNIVKVWFNLKCTGGRGVVVLRMNQMSKDIKSYAFLVLWKERNSITFLRPQGRHSLALALI